LIEAATSSVDPLVPWERQELDELFAEGHEFEDLAARWLSPFRGAIATDASAQKQNRVTAG